MEFVGWSGARSGWLDGEGSHFGLKSPIPRTALPLNSSRSLGGLKISPPYTIAPPTSSLDRTPPYLAAPDNAARLPIGLRSASYLGIPCSRGTAGEQLPVLPKEGTAGWNANVTHLQDKSARDYS